MNHFNLFSGIGAVELAAEWAGFKTVGQCEIDDFCLKVLNKHWPDVPKWRDVRDVTRESIQERGIDPSSITVLSASWPCQAWSVAGEMQGAKDDRNLWPETIKVIREVRPTWFVGENVANFPNMALRDTLSDLEQAGYEAEPFVFPASAVKAKHTRQRFFVVAYSESQRLSGRGEGEDAQEERAGGYKLPPRCPEVGGLPQRGAGQGDKSRVARDVYGTPDGMDGCGLNPLDALAGLLDEFRWPSFMGEERCDWEPPRLLLPGSSVKNQKRRIMALGNAVVPQQILPIFAAIALIEGGVTNPKEQQ